jgi:hypothetical protein
VPITQRAANGAAAKVTRYAVATLDGEVLAYHVRHDFPDGRKSIAWELPGGRPGLGGLRVDELPLYIPPDAIGLDEAGALILTEGEKAAAALAPLAANLKVAVAGTVTGAHAAPSPDALRPYTEKVPVIFMWPDNDQAGRRHAARVAANLRAAGAVDIRLITWPDAPDKGDAADFIAAGASLEDLRALLREAVAAPEEEPRAEEGEAEPLVTTGQPWPSPVAKEAFQGLAGEIVRAIEPHSEADPVAILVQFLTAFGSAAGRHVFFPVEADRHFANIYVVLVGETAKARKGTSLGHVLRLCEYADPAWRRERVVEGLSSGEGLVWAVRDAVVSREAIKEKGRVVGYQEIETDAGVADKRLLVTESEFAAVLKVAGREGNTLSAVLRQAWDAGNLRTLTKNSPARATGAHISIIGHITRDELVANLTSTDACNGFANRFLWLAVRRSKLLPDGGAFHLVDVEPLAARLREALTFARQPREVLRDEDAGRMWREVYAALSEGRPGLLGAMTARAEAQVMRLALIYALVDRSCVIAAPHLEAALALWTYAEDSVRWAVGDLFGDAVADAIRDALIFAGDDGLTRTEISAMLGRHAKASRIDAALQTLEAAGLVTRGRRETGGRPAEIWRCGPAK